MAAVERRQKIGLPLLVRTGRREDFPKREAERSFAHHCA
jgi:hypothetical protein